MVIRTNININACHTLMTIRVNGNASRVQGVLAQAWEDDQGRGNEEVC